MSCVTKHFVDSRMQYTLENAVVSLNETRSFSSGGNDDGWPVISWETQLKQNQTETKMALQAKLYGHDAALSLSLHFLPPRAPPLPFQSRGGGVSLDFHSFKPQRLLRVVLAMAVKRSPKRLKYSSPRFTKVLISLSLPQTLFGSLENGFKGWEICNSVCMRLLWFRS